MLGSTTGGTEHAIAAIDIPRAGHLISVEWSVRAFYDTTLDFSDYQLSFGSVGVIANDSRQVISNVTLGGMVFTAGGSIIAVWNSMTILPDVIVGQGERLFLHAISAAGVVGTARVCLGFDFDLDLPRARRR